MLSKEQEQYNRRIRNFGIWALHFVFRRSLYSIAKNAGLPYSTVKYSYQRAWDFIIAKMWLKMPYLRRLMRGGIKFIHLSPAQMDKILLWEKANGIYKQGGISQIERASLIEDKDYAKRQKEDTLRRNGKSED